MGNFGDKFGAVNALFSGLALFGIIVSILIQQKELNLQRNELKETRREFLINRLTNIVFNKTDNLIKEINSYSLDVGNDRIIDDYRLSIDEFVEYLRTIDGNQTASKKDMIKHFLNKNERVINRIVLKIYSSFMSVERAVTQSKLETEDSMQILSLMASGLNDDIKALLNDYKLHMKEPKSAESGTTDAFNQSNYEFFQGRIHYILNFGR